MRVRKCEIELKYKMENLNLKTRTFRYLDLITFLAYDRPP